MQPIGVFKYKDQVLFRIYDYGHCFFCELDWSADWKQFDRLHRMAIGEAFKLPKQFKTIEDMKQGTKYWVHELHFEWGREEE